MRCLPVLPVAETSERACLRLASESLLVFVCIEFVFSIPVSVTDVTDVTHAADVTDVAESLLIIVGMEFVSPAC